MKLKRILIPVLCVVLLLSMFTAVACKASQTPEMQFATSLNKTVKQVRSWDTVSAIENAKNGGSIRAEVTLPMSMTGADKNYVIDATVWMADKNNQLAVDAKMTAGTSSISGKVYFDEKALVLESKELLGKNAAYGVDLKTLVSDFSSSVFVPNKNNENTWAMDEETWAQIKPILEKFPNLLDELKKIREQENTLYVKFIDMALESIVENSTVTLNKETVSVLGEDVSANTFTVELNKEVLAKALEALWTKVKADEDVKALLNDVLPMISEVAGMAGDSELPVDMSQLSSVESIFTMADPYVQQAVTAIKSIPTDINVTLKLALNKKGVVMRADIDVAIGNDTLGKMEYNISIELGKTLNTFEGLAVSLKGPNPQNPLQKLELALNITVDEDTKDSYKLSLATKGFTRLMGGEISGRYSRNRTTGDAQLTLTAPGKDGLQTVAFNFNYVNDKGTHTIKNIGIVANNETVPLPPITITLKEKDTMPSYNKNYKNILKMTEAEFTTFTDMVETNAAKVSEIFAPFEGMTHGGSKEYNYDYDYKDDYYDGEYDDFEDDSFEDADYE